MIKKTKVLLNQINIWYFILGIVAVIVTGFCSGLPTIDGNQTVSIIEILVKHYEEIRLQNTWLDAFYSIVYGWFILLLPVIIEIPALPLFCDEIKSRNYQLQIARVGIKKYINQHFLTSFLEGFFLMVVALGLLALIVGQIFPWVHDYGGLVIVGYEEPEKQEMVQSLLKGIFRFSLLGGMMAVFSNILVALTRNIYIVLSLPFLINYICRHPLMRANNYTLIILTIIFYLLGYYIWYIKYRRLAL